MIKLFFLLFLLISSSVFSQTKYFIYFVDKGIEPTAKLEKSSEIYQSALELLSEKSIKRRIKHMGKEDFITFADLPIKEEYINNIKSLGIEIDNELRWFNTITAYLNPEQINLLNTLNFIEKIEPVKTLKFKNAEVHSYYPLEKPSGNQLVFDYGPSFAQLQLSEIPIVHARGITGDGILLGLLDTGFDWKNHESLTNANVFAEYDFVFNDFNTANDSNDLGSQHNHGTLVFSIVGGFKDSSLIGSAFGSSFILAKTEYVGSETHVEEDNYAAALEWMEGFGVDVTSSSLGYSIFDPGEFSYDYQDMDGNTTIVTRAAELAFRRGVVTITSAGNEGNDPWFYIIAPADGFNTLGIGAVHNNNQIAEFSSRGPTSDGRIKPDVLTQGVSVYCAQAGNYNGYINASGTSVAAPIAGGIAALILSTHPHLTNKQLRNILLETADNSESPNNERGYGLISALRAIEFPNLQFTDGAYSLKKTFIEKDNVNPQTVKIHYSISGEEFTEADMQFDGIYSYNFKFPFLFAGDLVNFFVTYNDLNSNTFRDPVEDVYKFFYGQLNVQLNLNLKIEYTDFIVSEPYPNPFIPKNHTETYLDVKSSGGENLSVIIIDALGQQVKKFNQITVEGTNRIIWRGESKNGGVVSTGAYYFLINLNERKFSRSLILLR